MLDANAKFTSAVNPTAIAKPSQLPCLQINDSPGQRYVPHGILPIRLASLLYSMAKEL
jgi:hypothetical protein